MSQGIEQVFDNGGPGATPPAPGTSRSGLPKLTNKQKLLGAAAAVVVALGLANRRRGDVPGAEGTDLSKAPRPSDYEDTGTLQIVVNNPAPPAAAPAPAPKKPLHGTFKNSKGQVILWVNGKPVAPLNGVYKNSKGQMIRWVNGKPAGAAPAAAK